MNGIVEKEGMMKYITLNSTVVNAQWVEKKSKWIVRIKGKYGKEWDEEADLFLNGTGFLK